jgi:hypothetical protein
VPRRATAKLQLRLIAVTEAQTPSLDEPGVTPRWEGGTCGDCNYAINAPPCRHPVRRVIQPESAREAWGRMTGRERALYRTSTTEAGQGIREFT